MFNLTDLSLNPESLKSLNSKSDINEVFVNACVCGDHETIDIILNSIKEFNIDVADNLGRSALRLAVTNENTEVKEKNVQFVLAALQLP